ncbi:MAG: cobalamin B12-binding domain-containing protein [Desulfobacteraceae bacterium]|nr:cobalamin B12-binding domain-containing protein [Desulfobacteraceae bacterium]MBU4054574.1 cobalamin B12-binding domain-containing protein [Pseudomonadota bacterium]
MNPQCQALKSKLEDLVDGWKTSGLPGRQTLMDMARDLLEWKKEKEITGLWAIPPVFATATLDDAWGYGLELIGAYAKVLGMKVVPLGLEKSAREIIEACHEIQPDYLGMTILQFDSEEDLCDIGRQIPDKTRLIAGGPVFKSDPDMAGRARVFFMAKNVAAFIRFFLHST